MSCPVRSVAGDVATVVTLVCASSLGAVTAIAQPSGPGSSGADLITPAPAGHVRVLDASLQGADTTAARFRLDTGVFALPNLPPCGQRPCPPGPSLRVVRVAPPAPHIPTSATIPVTVEFENRGRNATAPVDVRLDLTNPFGPESRDVFTLRPLRTGERVRVVRAFRTPQDGGSNRLGAWVEPGGDGRPGLGIAPGQSEPFQLEGPVLQWVRVDVPGQVPVGAPVRLAFAVRNASAAATAPATEVAIQTLGYAGGGARPDPAGYRFTLPAIPPRATLIASLEAQGLTAGNGFFDLSLAADPDHVHKWGNVAVWWPTPPTRVRVGAGR